MKTGNAVMAGLVPAIHVFLAALEKAWVAGTTPGHVEKSIGKRGHRWLLREAKIRSGDAVR